MSSDHLTTERALYWIDRCDRQQGYYMPDREERFAVIGDVLEELVSGRTCDVDLGVGPGSVVRRLLDRLPGATVVGIDADPLLLEVANLGYGGARFRTVDADLREDG